MNDNQTKMLVIDVYLIFVYSLQGVSVFLH